MMGLRHVEEGRYDMRKPFLHNIDTLQTDGRTAIPISISRVGTAVLTCDKTTSVRVEQRNRKITQTINR